MVGLFWWVPPGSPPTRSRSSCGYLGALRVYNSWQLHMARGVTVKLVSPPNYQLLAMCSCDSAVAQILSSSPGGARCLFTTCTSFPGYSRDGKCVPILPPRMVVCHVFAWGRLAGSFVHVPSVVGGDVFDR